MSDEIKHECAMALLRLLEAPVAGAAGVSGGAAPRSLPDPGGTLLSLLLEKQHNRGQDGAGAAVLSLSPEPGQPAWWIGKSASATALADLLGAIAKRPGSRRAAEKAEPESFPEKLRASASSAPPRDNGGERIFLGHLRYATYGRGDESFCHPFVHAEPRLDRTLFLAGNFNLTNTHELFGKFRYAVELKMKRNFSPSQSPEQLAGYLDHLGLSEGWMAVFDDDASKSWEEKLYTRDMELGGKTLHIVGL